MRMIVIRSQDKETLIEIKRIEVENIGTVNEPKWCVMGNAWILGYYSSKERAMEVLDEIEVKVSIPAMQRVYQMPKE